MARQFKFMVIGGGTGGLRTAIAASKICETALVEPGVLGGTCLNTGCIPTKAMLHAAHLYRDALSMKDFGINASSVKVNFPKVMKRVRNIIKEGQSHIMKGMKKNNVLVLFKGKAEFINGNTIKVGNEEISAEKIIIATGASNMVPPIKGLDQVKYYDNESIIYSLNKLPKSIIMIGGGYISMEFATFFAEMGSKVTVLERFPKILGMLDDDVSGELLDIYQKIGIKPKTNINIIEVKKAGKQIALVYNDVRDPNSKKITVKADCLSISTGRVPNTQGLALEKAGVNLGQKKEIIVNNFLETSNPNIYAMGDVTARAMFAHAAKRESKIIIENSLNGKKLEMNFDLVPWAVFTNPPVAGVGLSENQAKQKNMQYGVLKAPYTKAGRAEILGKTDGFVKVVYNKPDNKILGCTIIGENSDDMIHEFAAVMNDSCSVDVIRKTVHVHPTLSEVNEELREEKD